jgi:hypothetical protein
MSKIRKGHQPRVFPSKTKHGDIKKNEKGVLEVWVYYFKEFLNPVDKGIKQGDKHT